MITNRKEVFCLCVESRTVSACLGEANVSGMAIVNSLAVAGYEGFFEGKFIDEQSFLSAIRKCVGELGSEHRLPKTCFIGVPSEFLKTIVVVAGTQFDYTTKINAKIIENIFAMKNPFAEHTNYTLIEKSAISFRIDDGNVIIDVLGLSCNKVQARLSYTGVVDTFLKSLKNALKPLGVQYVVPIPLVYAETMNLFPAKQRDLSILYCNVDNGSTTVSIIRGDGIRYLKAFSLGRDDVVTDLMEVKNIDYRLAEALFEKLDLSSLTSQEYYVVNGENQAYSFSMVDINTIVKERLDEIAYYINACLENSGLKIPDNMPLCFTGKGIAEIRGAKECLETSLKRPIEIVRFALTKYGSPAYTSLNGLLREASTLAETKSELSDKTFKI